MRTRPFIYRADEAPTVYAIEQHHELKKTGTGIKIGCRYEAPVSREIGSEAEKIQSALLRPEKAPLLMRFLESLDRDWPAWFALGAAIGGAWALLVKHGLL